MSLQAIWIVQLPSAIARKDGRLLFSRIYPTCVKKEKIAAGIHYVPLPPNPDFVKSLFFELGYTKEGMSHFIAARDSCQKDMQNPVYEIATSAGKLWPLVVVEQYGIVYCCLPYVEQGVHTRPPLIDLPGVTQGFSLLCAIADFLRPVPHNELYQKIPEIYSFLTHAAPFGSPLDTNVESVIAKMTNRPSTVMTKSQKQPGWKPVIHKGKNHIYLSVTEYVRAVQYDWDDAANVWDVYGTISCKAELECVMPEITVTVSQAADGEITPLDHLLIHPCVQSADTSIIDPGAGQVRANPRRVRFSPPNEMVTLCHYTASRIQGIPITGSFEMFVEEKKVNLKVKLKLHEKIKNQFEYCELQIPFHNRGPIASHDSLPSSGSMMLSPDRKVLAWNIGQKFSSKTLEVNLTATVQFADPSKQPASPQDDPFCVGQNAYAQLYFKIPDYTHSGCYIDPKSVQVSPSMKYKLTAVREYISKEYKFWNIQGDALRSVIPKCLTTLNNGTIDLEEK
ncbi:hypothetical protein ACJMK2_035940 [Sinanodonta woodiana]|uniref:AP-5 complex subunit mu-1 n=1 Tax=Sinanodonta woodiana TaxID=1069815 RepID=A0ABD3WFM0_SINWO